MCVLRVVWCVKLTLYLVVAMREWPVKAVSGDSHVWVHECFNTQASHIPKMVIPGIKRDHLIVIMILSSSNHHPVIVILSLSFNHCHPMIVIPSSSSHYHHPSLSSCHCHSVIVILWLSFHHHLPIIIIHHCHPASMAQRNDCMVMVFSCDSEVRMHLL